MNLSISKVLFCFSHLTELSHLPQPILLKGQRHRCPFGGLGFKSWAHVRSDRGTSPQPQYLPHVVPLKMQDDLKTFLPHHCLTIPMFVHFVDADTSDSSVTDFVRLLELSPPSSTFGTKLCRNISFPNRPRLSVRPSAFTGHPPAAAEGKSGNRRAGGEWSRGHPLPPSSEPWSATRCRVSWRSSGHMA